MFVVMSTAMTRFCCRFPTSCSQEGFTVFGTRPLEDQGKLTERYIRDFPSPEAFHTLKVQGFNHNRIILSHKPKGQLKEVVSSPTCDFLMDPGEVTFGTEPAIRQILLPREGLVCRTHCVETCLIELWRLYFRSI